MVEKEKEVKRLKISVHPKDDIFLEENTIEETEEQREIDYEKLRGSIFETINNNIADMDDLIPLFREMIDHYAEINTECDVCFFLDEHLIPNYGDNLTNEFNIDLKTLKSLVKEIVHLICNRWHIFCENETCNSHYKDGKKKKELT